MLDLTGKHAVIFGVASEDSIAWAVARKLHEAGAEISLAYQQRFKSRILKLINEGDTPVRFYDRCDVTKPEEIEAFFSQVGAVDVLVHSVAYANPEAFAHPISQLRVEDFQQALTISAFSLVPLVRAALPKMERGGSVMAMTYLGGSRVVTNYKLMGIAKAALDHTVRELAVDVGPRNVRVNAISAGPVRTLAASQIPGLEDMLRVYEEVTPMRRAISTDDVGNMATFLASDLARNVTGQVLYVDSGYSILAMPQLEG
jgi:enoyl-[acyl-carrier protein] reductase I